MGVYGCEIIGFSNIFLHIGTVLITLPILMLKRSLEHHPRKLRIWCFDVSKQLVGATISLYTLVELRNLSNFCTRYFIFLLADGVLMNFFAVSILILLQIYLSSMKNLSFTTGFYTKKSECQSWLYQVGIWTIACVSSKLIVLLLLTIFEMPINAAASVLLLTVRWDKDFESFFTLIIFPVILNCIILWKVDSLIMDPIHLISRRRKRIRTDVRNETERKCRTKSIAESMRVDNTLLMEPLIDKHYSAVDIENNPLQSDELKVSQVEGNDFTQLADSNLDL